MKNENDDEQITAEEASRELRRMIMSSPKLRRIDQELTLQVDLDGPNRMDPLIEIAKKKKNN